MFDRESLNQAVHQALIDTPDIPHDATGAFVLVANETGLHAVTAVKIGERWNVAAEFSYAGTRESIGYGVQVKGHF